MTDFTQDLLDVADRLTYALGGHDSTCAQRFDCEDFTGARCLTQKLRRAVQAYASPQAAQERVEVSRAAARGRVAFRRAAARGSR